VIRTAWLVARKDLRIEMRSRVLLWQVTPFAVLALVLAGLALGPTQAGSSSSAPGLFYLVVLFVALAVVQRSRGIESTPGTRASISTLGLDPGGVFLGKALALTLELWVLGAILLAGSVLFLHVALMGALKALPSVAVTLGVMSTAGTIYGALTTGGDGPVTLLPLLTLPAFAPLLVAGERSLSAALYGGALWEWWVIVVVALVAYVAVGIAVYGVLEES
jgi:heme exporter protein B